MKSLLCTIGLLCFLGQVFGQATIPCKYTDPTTDFDYDLNPLVDNSADYVVQVPTGTDSDTAVGYKITLNVCRPTFNTACSSTAGTQCDACQQWPLEAPKYQNALGKTSATNLTSAQDTSGQDGEGLTMLYGGFTTSMTINFVCETGAGKGHPTYVKKPNADSFLLQWKSKYACATNGNASGGGSSGLSGGSIMMIIVLVVVVVYLAAGISWQKFKNHAEGTDLIPNKEFWISLPGLVKDGIMFLVGKIKGCAGGGNSYQKF